MNVFDSLKQRTKILIVAGSLFLLSLSFGLLIFGDNSLSPANQVIYEVKEGLKADLFYAHPEHTEH